MEYSALKSRAIKEVFVAAVRAGRRSSCTKSQPYLHKCKMQKKRKRSVFCMMFRTRMHVWCLKAAKVIPLQVDRNLMLYLPRLTVLVTIVADRPGAWFPGPLGPYLAWFPAICLRRDFKRAKVPGNPMKSPFCFGVFWGGHIQKKNIFASRQPNHVKHLLSGQLLTGNFHSLRSPPGDPRGAYCSNFSIQKLPPTRFRVFVR